MDLGKPDAWTKLLELSLSPRVSVKVLGALLLLAISSNSGSLDILITAFGPTFSRTGVIGLWSLACFTISVILVESFARAVRKLQATATARRQARAEQDRLTQQHKEIALRTSHLLPGLGSEAKSLLGSLGTGGVKLRKDALIFELEKLNFIEREVDLGTTSGVYRLHPAARAGVRDILGSERKKALRENIKAAGENGKEFLRLYVINPPASPDLPDHPFMRSDVYRAATRLRTAGVLSSSPPDDLSRSGEVMEICQDAIPLVEEMLREKLTRTVIFIDFTQVASSVEGGSGLRNY